jgi:outer membrane protein
MMKRKFILCTLLVCLGSALQAQQITRFAVVDLSKVYTAFFSDSQAVRELEAQSSRVQSDIDRMNAEIQSLKNAKLAADSRGDQNQSLQLESQIDQKTAYLREYYQVQTAELERQRKALSQSGSFLQQVYDEIRFIAESEGYSMVLNLKANSGILWYSPTVDITDKLIKDLQEKSGH